MQQEKRLKKPLENYKINDMEKNVVKIIVIVAAALCLCSCFAPPSGDGCPFPYQYYRIFSWDISANRNPDGTYKTPEELLFHNGEHYLLTQKTILKSVNFPQTWEEVLNVDTLRFPYYVAQHSKSVIYKDRIYGMAYIDTDARLACHSPKKLFSYDLVTHEFHVSTISFESGCDLCIDGDSRILLRNSDTGLWVINEDLSAEHLSSQKIDRIGGLSDGYWFSTKEKLNLVIGESITTADIPNVEEVVEFDNDSLCVIKHDNTNDMSMWILGKDAQNIENVTSFSFYMDGVIIDQCVHDRRNIAVGVFGSWSGLLCSSDGGRTWTSCFKGLFAGITHVEFINDELVIMHVI